MRGACAGLAAGFDKDAQAVEGLLGMGLGFVEIGDDAPLHYCPHAATCSQHVVLNSYRGQC